MSSSSDDTFIKAARYGNYYCPATLHYEERNASVDCDRCHKKSLQVCIGYDRTDLCLQCVNYLISTFGEKYNFKISN